ncbi:MAG TPA: CPXCG motif-containing cysteine-rich protein [Balneolaceae bacterium]|nr:CPXCG motif-containing cysteine-rich protein [Balneolaceae bacterium]
MDIQEESQGTGFTCAYCGEINDTFVDPSQGKVQKYIEDCQVCCKPNELSVSYDEWTEEYLIRAEQSQ